MSFEASLDSNLEHPPALQLKKLRKVYASNVPALAGVDLSVMRGELISLLGPSGCGKSTLCKLISGVELCTEGTVLLHGKDVTDRPPHQRPVHMVWQDRALFPHMSVWDQIAYSLRLQRRSKHEIKTRVSWIIERMQLQGLGRRRPHELSGGQQQRLSLARVLVDDRAQVLLLDEPLTNLEPHLRVQLREFIAGVQREFKCTMIHVTHDPSEALAISTRLGVMRDGHLLQIGTPTELYSRPNSRFVAEFLGRVNFIHGQFSNDAFETDDGSHLPVPRLHPHPGAGWYGIRPEHCTVVTASDSSDGFLRGVIAATVLLGPVVELRIQLTNGSDFYGSAAVPESGWCLPGTAVAVKWSKENAIVVQK